MRDKKMFVFATTNERYVLQCDGAVHNDKQYRDFWYLICIILIVIVALHTHDSGYINNHNNNNNNDNNMYVMTAKTKLIYKGLFIGYRLSVYYC